MLHFFQLVKYNENQKHNILDTFTGWKYDKKKMYVNILKCSL